MTGLRSAIAQGIAARLLRQPEGPQRLRDAAALMLVLALVVLPACDFTNGRDDDAWSATSLPGVNEVAWDEPQVWAAANGDTSVIVASDGYLPDHVTTRVWRSTDGKRWALVPHALPGAVRDVTTFRGQFVAVGWEEEGAVKGWHSDDGRRWTDFTVPDSLDLAFGELHLASVGKTALLYRGHPCRAVGTEPSPAPTLADVPECVVYLSADLEHWDRVPSPYLRVVFGLDHRWAAMGDIPFDPASSKPWWTSPDGRAWQASPQPFQDADADWVGKIGTRFVAIGKGNAAANCERWPPMSAHVVPRCHHVISWTSADGSSWVRHVQDLSVRTTYRPALPVVEGGGRLWSVVDDQVLVSDGGTTWRTDTAPWPGSTHISAITSFGDDSLVVAGVRRSKPVAWTRHAG